MRTQKIKCNGKGTIQKNIRDTINVVFVCNSFILLSDLKYSCLKQCFKNCVDGLIMHEDVICVTIIVQRGRRDGTTLEQFFISLKLTQY